MLYLILFLHWMFDFVLQTDKMAINKSKSLKWLSLHCAVYTIPWLFFGWQFGLAVGLSHFLIDFVTSKVNSYLWQKELRHYFFVLIGFDQLLHISIILYFAKIFQT